MERPSHQRAAPPPTIHAPATPAPDAPSGALAPWRRARPVVEAIWGVACIAGATALLVGKAAFLAAAGLAAFGDVGVLANLALLGGGAMFLREARRHARDERPVDIRDATT